MCRLLLLDGWLNGGGLCLAAMLEVLLETLPGLGLLGALVTPFPRLVTFLFGWAEAPMVGCLWLFCLEDLTGLFRTIAPMTLWQPSLAILSLVRSSSGLLRVLASLLVVDRCSQSFF